MTENCQRNQYWQAVEFQLEGNGNFSATLQFFQYFRQFDIRIAFFYNLLLSPGSVFLV